MKDMKMGQKMRWVAGVVYLALAIYQLFTMRFLIMALPSGNGSVPFTQFTAVWIIGLLLAFVYAGMAVWMLSGKSFLTGNVQRAIVVATIFVVAYELLSYSSQAEAMQIMLMFTLPSIAETTIWQLIFIIIRMVLLILAAFFVTSANEKMGAQPEAEQTDEEQEALEAIESELDAIEADALVVEEVAVEIKVEYEDEK